MTLIFNTGCSLEDYLTFLKMAYMCFPISPMARSEKVCWWAVVASLGFKLAANCATTLWASLEDCVTTSAATHLAIEARPYKIIQKLVM